MSFFLLAKQGFRSLPEKYRGCPSQFCVPSFIHSIARLSHPKSAESLCRSPLCMARYGEARQDKRRPARAVSCRSFGTPKQRGIPRHVSDRLDVSPTFADLPSVSFHSGQAVSGANGDTSGSMTGTDPSRRICCLSQNRKSPPDVCPGRPSSNPPGRTLYHPSFIYLIYTSCLFPYTVLRVPLPAWTCRPDLLDAKVCHRVLIVRTEMYFLQILPLAECNFQERPGI